MPEYKIETSDGLECMVAFSKLESILLKLGREGNFNEIKKIYKLNADIPGTTGAKILGAALSTRQDSALEELLKFLPKIEEAASASLMGEVKQAIADNKPTIPSGSQSSQAPNLSDLK